MVNDYAAYFSGAMLAECHIDMHSIWKQQNEDEQAELARIDPESRQKRKFQADRRS